MSGEFAAALRVRAREIGTALRGIAMLTFGEAAGIRAFTNDMAVTRRSFVAALFALPIFVLVRIGTWIGGVAPLDPPHLLALELLTFPITWAGFALISLPLVRMLADGRQWPRYITAWNWCNLAQLILLFIALVPSVLPVPAVVSETCALVGYGWTLWLEWYVTKLALELTPTAAALLVAIDVGFSAIVSLAIQIPWGSLSVGL